MGTLTCKELHSLAVFSAQKRAIEKRCMDDFCLVVLSKSLPNKVGAAHIYRSREGAAKSRFHRSVATLVCVCDPCSSRQTFKQNHKAKAVHTSFFDCTLLSGENSK